MRDAITIAMASLPAQLRRSLTWDQGSELSQHAMLSIDTGLDVYFCDPQSPWQTAREIARLANSGKFDLVVMGCHGRGAAGAAVLGSVVQKVLASTKTPVLVIR